MRLKRPAFRLNIAVVAMMGMIVVTGSLQPSEAGVPPEPNGDAKPAPPSTVPLAEPPAPPTSADFAHKPGQAAPTAATSDLTGLAIDELRARANAEEPRAMEELARRLLQGVGVAKDQQAGAGWLLRAAQHGSGQAAFNVGVMYERGFVVERDSTRAVEWYRKAIQADISMAKHNLALMLRDGKGVARNTREAIELLRSAAHQGMGASMFALGDLYERGEPGTKDPVRALAWFAITAEFERQTNRDGDSDSTLGKAALQRADALRRTLSLDDLDRGQQVGQSEFKQIVEALQATKPATATASPNGAVAWPDSSAEQVRAIQQALFDLKLLHDRPDGVMGPMTRAAIKSFQKSLGQHETGEVTKDLFAALQTALAHRGRNGDGPANGPARSKAN